MLNLGHKELCPKISQSQEGGGCFENACMGSVSQRYYTLNLLFENVFLGYFVSARCSTGHSSAEDQDWLLSLTISYFSNGEGSLAACKALLCVL